VELVTFATDEWITALFAAAKASADLLDSLKDFEGPMTLVMEPCTPQLPAGLVVWLDAGRGEIRAVEKIPTADSKPAKYVLKGPYELWQKIAQGKQGMLKAIMFGKLHVTGSKAVLLKHVRTATVLTKLLIELPTRFP
jgi:hypothetical protein